MAHAQKPDFVFRRNGRVHLNRWGCQFSRLLAAEVCASAWVMLDRPRSEVAWEYWLPTPFASFPFTSPPVRHRVPPGSERALDTCLLYRGELIPCLLELRPLMGDLVRPADGRVEIWRACGMVRGGEVRTVWTVACKNVTLCLPETPHGLPWQRSWVFVVRRRLLQMCVA